MNYAGFSVRLKASLIDFLILLIPMFILQFQLPYVSCFFVYLFYKPIFEASRLQGTPGKAMSGIAVTGLNGEQLTLKQALIRYGSSLVSGLFFFAGYWLMFFTEKKQTFHDLMSDSMVVKKEPAVQNHYFDLWLSEIKKLFSQEPSTATAGIEGTGSAGVKSSSVAEDLEKLNNLLNSKLITEEEYQQKRSEILRRI